MQAAAVYRKFCNEKHIVQSIYVPFCQKHGIKSYYLTELVAVSFICPPVLKGLPKGYNGRAA